MPRLMAKLLRGATDDRPSRFHTQEGRLAPATAYLRLPLALLEYLRRRWFDRLAEAPWIPPSATRRIRRRLSPAARVLEIGAGMSTLWLAARCGSLLSIEADRQWHDRLAEIVAQRRLRHVNLQHRWHAADMCDFSTVADGSLDLCLVDGGPRLDCARAALPKLRPDGWLYVDNTDLYPETKAFLESVGTSRPCRLNYFRGFAPACLFINEGALLELTPG
jgi:hypothetical protein